MLTGHCCKAVLYKGVKADDKCLVSIGFLKYG
uniref:Uncharacterized protein n=1 Tax=Anguilla anguilla TaxID=7936 RepID=A0A0E9VU59_ANGAN